jgi:acetoin utilization deacetylase AcuC-like enzyme
LADFTNNDFYLKTLESNLKNLLDQVQPDFIFFQSGVDVLDTDKLGKLGITRAGCKQRDRIVLEAAKKNKIPLVASMGGGYSPDFRDIIEAHANTFRLAQEIFF